jgi:hypothetical protein
MQRILNAPAAALDGLQHLRVEPRVVPLASASMNASSTSRSSVPWLPWRASRSSPPWAMICAAIRV